MKDLKKILASGLILLTLSAGALAVEPQKDQREPPPKDPKVFDKKDKPPREEPRRENRDKPKDDKRGKPPG